MSDNRRTSTRHDVALDGTCTHAGQSLPMSVSNISLGGALVSTGVKYAMGQRVAISFTIPTIDTEIEIGAIVRWSDDKATGLQFDGLRARDVWALNKFFELLSSL